MTEAGWYNDEQDPARARWHDGQAWTRHTLVKADWAGRGAPPPPRPAVQPQRAFGSTPPDTERKPQWLVLGLIAVAIAGVAFFISRDDGVEVDIDEMNAAFGIEDGGPCSETFAAGRPTSDVLEDADAAPCTDEDGESVVQLMAFYDCEDGRTLHWNDQGWGFSDADWSHHKAGSDNTPPDSAFSDCYG